MSPRILLALVFIGAASIAACTHSARPEASKASQVAELAVGKNGTYIWHKRSWEVEELKNALKSDVVYPRIVEIRLINGPNPSSLQNLIEIGQIAKAVGVKASYENGDKVNSINIVQ